MQSFKKLLDTVRSSNPDLISEEAANEMLTQFNASVDQMKADSLAEGRDLGWKEGYDEGKRVAADEAKRSMEELAEKLDTQALEKLKAILDVVNAEHEAENEANATKLQEIYDMIMDNMVPKAELEAMDEDHAEKFQNALETLDNEYADKLTIATEAVKSNLLDAMEKREKFHNSKLKAVKLALESKLENAEKLLLEEKERKLDILAESVEKYMNYALQKAIPTKQLISEQKYFAAQKSLDKIASVLKINSILQESKDGVFQDYERKLSESKETANKLIAENADLKSKLEVKDAKILLESKIAKCTPSEQAFLRRYFDKADSKKIIEEQIEDARSVFKRLYAEKRQGLVEKQNSISSKPTAVVNESKEAAKKKESEEKTQIIAENKKETKIEKHAEASESIMSAYSSILTNK
jgi:hypothetical protein